MDVDDLRSLYLSELLETCDGEVQLVEALPLMAASAGSVQLRLIIVRHADQTMEHSRQLEAILRRHGTGLKHDVDHVAATLVGKARQIICGLSDSDLRDAALLTALRRVVQHQIAAYSAAEGYAEALLLGIDQRDLRAILHDEQSTDRRLASLQNEVMQLALLVSPLPY